MSRKLRIEGSSTSCEDKKDRIFDDPKYKEIAKSMVNTYMGEFYKPDKDTSELEKEK